VAMAANTAAPMGLIERSMFSWPCPPRDGHDALIVLGRQSPQIAQVKKIG
jgi:hypothetical protein